MQSGAWFGNKERNLELGLANTHVVEARAAWLRPVIVPVAWRYSVAIVLWLGDLAARVRAVREPLELDKPADKYVNIT